MFLNINNPLQNTIVFFLIFMILIYVIKPNLIYDHNKNKFRQFGFSDNNTLLPIYIVAILLSVILYIIFYNLSIMNKKSVLFYQSNSTNNNTNNNINNANNNANNNLNYDITNNNIEKIQNQINQLLQYQLLQQQLLQQQIINAKLNIDCNNKITNSADSNVINKYASMSNNISDFNSDIVISRNNNNSTPNNIMNDTDIILPNLLNI